MTWFAEVADADEGWAKGVEAVLRDGFALAGDRAFQDVHCGHLALRVPRDRMTVNPARPFDLITAVARFVWMMAGSERLADIQFYQPRVASYSDNGLEVPGSDYGFRLINPEPGLDQLSGVITRLRENRGSRRAAAVIWKAEDAVRESTDIPCAFGCFFAVRNGEVVATTVMRSNNAYTLLPWNLFEFTLLAELVASELKLPIGTYHHVMVSMHVYEANASDATAMVSAYHSHGSTWQRPVMPSMPPSSRSAVNRLAQLEASLRHRPRFVLETSVASLLEEAKDLHPYWQAFYQVILLHHLIKGGRHEESRQVLQHLPDYFHDQLEAVVSEASTDAEASGAPPQSAPSVRIGERVRIRAADDKARAQGLSDFEDELVAACEAIDAMPNIEPVGRREFLELRSSLAPTELIAARGRAHLKVETVLDALLKRRGAEPSA